uniref:C2H2-type domain-containing protein n=1 Tax=Solanum lycopersicum TaxID=4081 RepID=A0A3Q7ERJ9_SOLLC
MDLLSVTIVCIKLLAWPMLSLGYPLFVTIRAIEAGSVYDKRKVATYWIQFKLPNAITHLCSEWLKKLKKHSVSINKETFLAVAESCLDENDSLIANKIENISTSAIQVLSKPVIPAVAICPDTSSSLAVFQSRWTCEICQVTVRSELTLQSHLRGRKHRAEAMLWCTFCNLRVSGEIDMIAHLKGKRHLAKLQETYTDSETS